MAEMVNHPSHYNIPGRKECLDEMIDIYGIKATEKFCRMNAYKYHYRMGLKDGNSKEQDVAKAEWYENKADELKHVRKKRAEKKNALYEYIVCAICFCSILIDLIRAGACAQSTDLVGILINLAFAMATIYMLTVWMQ